MLLQEKDIIKILERFKKEITNNTLNSYWAGFSVLPFSLYNEKKVYIANHNNLPKEFKKQGDIYVGNWRKEFIANTMIEYAGEMMGIFNLDYFGSTSSLDKLYSLIVHETFHAYQLKSNFKVNYYEMTLLEYPFTKENLTLRVKEREELLKAVFSADKKIKKQHIINFISLREKRKEIIGDMINYDLGVESLEGTATYVEYKAYCDKSSLPNHFILSQFGDNLAGYPDDLDHFRHSNYSAGMFICLLLDQLDLKWQKEYLKSEKYLHEFFVEKVNLPTKEITVDDYHYGQYLAKMNQIKIATDFNQFLSKKGYKIDIVGEIQLALFNPMQIVKKDNAVLHKTFVKIKMDDTEFFINDSCITTHRDDLWKIDKITLLCKDKPIIENDGVTIEGVGQITGKVEVSDDNYSIYIK